MKKCRVCGKEFEVLYPELWRYRAGKLPNQSIWFCTWKCLRAWENRNDKNRKEVADNVNGSTHRDRREVISGLISAAEDGKSPAEYLEEIGYKAPYVTLSDLRKWAKDKAPDLYGKMNELAPKRTTGRKEKKTAEKPKVELVYDPEIEAEYKREQAQKKANAEAKAEAEKEWTPAAEVYGRAADEEDDRPPWEEKHQLMDERELWHTAAIRNDVLGVFYYDKKFNTVDWRHPAGEEISLPPADWFMLERMLNGVLMALGLDRQEWE